MSHHHAPGDASFSVEGVTARHSTTGGLSSLRVGIAVSRFNARITQALYAGAVEVLLDRGVSAENIIAVQVNGALELPVAIASLIDGPEVDCAVAIGCVIRGDTSHYDHVCSTTIDGLMSVQLESRIPIGIGVVTCENASQAAERSIVPASSGRNMGADAARAALDLGCTIQLINGGLDSVD